MEEFHNTTGEITMYNPDEECKAMIEALKKLCEQKNMSPYAVAKEAGISSSTVSYIMNGRTRPQMYTVLMMCNVLGVTISQLFEESAVISGKETESVCLEDAEKPGTNAESVCGRITGEEEELLRLCRSFSEKKKELLKIYMKTLQQL